jgi:hypothetical protein
MVSRRSSRVLILAVGVAVLALAGCSKGVERVVKVPGTVAWTDAGLDVKAGQKVTIKASGEIGPNKANRTGPAGFVSKPEWTKYNVLASAPHMALIGRLGKDGSPFLVGGLLTIDAPAGGRLFLGINDRDPGNNLGDFQATIALK